MAPRQPPLSLEARVRDTFFSAPSQVSQLSDKRKWATCTFNTSSSSYTPPASTSPPPPPPPHNNNNKNNNTRKRAAPSRRAKKSRDELWDPNRILSLASYLPQSSAALSGLLALTRNDADKDALRGKLLNNDAEGSAFKKRKLDASEEPGDDAATMEKEKEKVKDMDAVLNLHPRRRARYEERNPEKVSPKKDKTTTTAAAAVEKVEFIKNEEAIRRRKAREMDAILGLVSASEEDGYEELESSGAEPSSDDKQHRKEDEQVDGAAAEGRSEPESDAAEATTTTLPESTNKQDTDAKEKTPDDAGNEETTPKHSPKEGNDDSEAKTRSFLFSVEIPVISPLKRLLWN